MTDDPTNVIDLKAKRRAQTAKARAAAKASNPKPASGTPASGLPATGSGWGGPAKGSSATAGDLTTANAAPRRTADELASLAAQALQVMVDVMVGSETPEALKLMAAEKVLNRVEGTPVARTITATVDDDDERMLTDRDRAKAMALLLAKTRQVGG